MRLAPNSRVDRYIVEALLGEGAMAAVYRVRHEKLGTPYALKVLKYVTTDIRERLLQEGRVQSALRHPNIVNVTDVVLVGETPGLVLEFVEGASLDTLLCEQPLSLRQVDHLARGIFAGVEAAHGAGLIHRDLKPANILLALDHRHQFVPKITDFGLAKVLTPTERSDTTMPNVGFGTPAYMAPEQMENAAAVDHRADLFSLGAILYELLTGRRCFPGDDVAEVLEKVGEAEHVPIQEVLPDLPEHLVEAVEGCLTREPEDRWADVGALARCWNQDELDAVWAPETSNRMKALGAGVELERMPPADGPTDLRNPTPTPSQARAPAVSTMSLSTAPVPSPAPPPPKRRRRTPLLLGIGSLASITLGFGSLIIVAALGLYVWSSRAPTPVNSPPLIVPDPVPLAVAPPPPEPEPPSEPEPPPPEAPSPEPVVPVPVSAPPVQVKPVPATGAVYVESDVPVVLVGGDGSRHPPGSGIPVGAYTLEAAFSGGTQLTGFTFELRPGAVVHARCDDQFAVCQGR